MVVAPLLARHLQNLHHRLAEFCGVHIGPKVFESQLSVPICSVELLVFAPTRWIPWSPAGLLCRRDRLIVVDDTADHSELSLGAIPLISVPVKVTLDLLLSEKSLHMYVTCHELISSVSQNTSGYIILHISCYGDAGRTVELGTADLDTKRFFCVHYRVLSALQKPNSMVQRKDGVAAFQNSNAPG